MAGLDSILPDEAPDASASPTPTTGLGGYTTITGAKGAKTVLDPTNSEAVLKKMQDYLDERNSPVAKFQSSLQDAMAAWAPYTQANAAMSQRSTDKRAEAKDVQDMQMQIANFRAQQALQAQSRKDFGELIAQGGQGGQGNQGNQGGQGGQGNQGGQGGQGGMGAIDPLIMARIASLGQTDPVAAGALYDKTISENNQANQRRLGEMDIAKYNVANAPAGNEQKIYMKNGKPVMLTTNQWNALSKDQRAEFDPTPDTPVAPNAAAPNAAAPAGFDVHKTYGTPAKLLDNLSGAESSHDPYAINPDTKALGRYQFTPDTVAMLHKQGIKFNAFDPDESRAAADYYLQLLVKQNGGDYTKAIKDYGGYKKADPTKYLAQVLNGVDLTQVQPATTQAQPAITPAPPAITPAPPAITPAPPATTKAQVQTPQYHENEDKAIAYWAANIPATPEQFNQKDKEIAAARAADTAVVSDRLKQQTRAKLAGTQKENEKLADMAAKLEVEGESKKAGDTIAATNQVINHAKTHPEEFGKALQSNFSGGILSGINTIYKVGPAIEPYAETFGATFNPKTDAEGHTQNDRRNTTNTNATKIGFDYAAQMFAGTGARLGVGLENMVAKGKGVGTEHSAASNLMNAGLVNLSARKSRDLAPLWREYKRSMPEGDANFGDFLDTPPARQVDAKYNPEFIDWATKAKSIPGYLPGSKPSRYDEWKASQPSNKAAK